MTFRCVHANRKRRRTADCLPVPSAHKTHSSKSAASTLSDMRALPIEQSTNLNYARPGRVFIDKVSV